MSADDKFRVILTRKDIGLIMACLSESIKTAYLPEFKEELTTLRNKVYEGLGYSVVQIAE